MRRLYSGKSIPQGGPYARKGSGLRMAVLMQGRKRWSQSEDEANRQRRGEEWDHKDTLEL